MECIHGVLRIALYGALVSMTENLMILGTPFAAALRRMVPSSLSEEPLKPVNVREDSLILARFTSIWIRVHLNIGNPRLLILKSSATDEVHIFVYFVVVVYIYKLLHLLES